MDPSGSAPEESLNPLEQRLGRWQPAPGVLNRDRIMFEAGRAAARSEPHRLIEFAAIGCLLLLSLGLGGLLVRERSQPQVPGGRGLLAAKPEPPALTPPIPTQAAEPDPDSYLVLTHRIFDAPSDQVSSVAPGPVTAPFPAQLDPLLSPLRHRRFRGGVDL